MSRTFVRLVVIRASIEGSDTSVLMDYDRKDEMFYVSHRDKHGAVVGEELSFPKRDYKEAINDFLVEVRRMKEKNFDAPLHFSM